MAQGVHPVVKEDFYKALELVIEGRISLTQAGPLSGMSVPTFQKYANMVLLGEPLPDNLFESRQNVKKIKKEYKRRKKNA